MSKRKQFIYASFLVTSWLFMGCLDEYSSANPPIRKDSPVVNSLTVTGEAIRSFRANGTEVVYVEFGQKVVIDVNVIDAPGLIDSAIVSLSDKTIGTVAVVKPSFDAVRLKEKGTFQIEYTADDDNTGFVTLSVTVKDTQNVKGEKDIIRTPGKTSVVQSLTFRAISCLPTRNLVGVWTATSSGDDSEDVDDDGTFDYENLTSKVTFSINTTGSSLLGESAAIVRISDPTFGLYAYQGFAPPAGRISFCGDQIVGYIPLTGVGQAITMTGQINPNGTISLEWSNVFGDTGTVLLTKE